jgi:SAM-dependent MidA family methyltransferase
MKAATLPVPDAQARAHSARVVALVRDEVERAAGFMPFTRYMELVLYAPGLGYYVAGAQKFGEAGDFVTGPEMTPLYGAALATQIASILVTIPGAQIVELGAGSGALAASVLVALAQAGAAPPRDRNLEVRPPLRALLRSRLAARSP